MWVCMYVLNQIKSKYISNEINRCRTIALAGAITSAMIPHKNTKFRKTFKIHHLLDYKIK